MDEGTAAKLDPEIARIAGANAYLLKNYVDQKSGAVVLVLILYGKASSVFGHNPEICYPANGYQRTMPPVDTTNTWIPRRGFPCDFAQHFSPRT